MLKAVIFDLDAVTKEEEPDLPYVQNLMEELRSSGCSPEIMPCMPEKEIKDFLEISYKLGIFPSECLVISDTCKGLRNAKAAGMARIGFWNSNLGNQDLREAQCVIEGFDEIDFHFIQQVYQHSKGEPATIGETTRLLLRELDMTDIPRMREISRLPEVNCYTGEPLRSLEEELEIHKAYIENAYHFWGYGFWGVFLKSDGRLIGRCGIQNCEINGQTEIELGYLLDPSYQGARYATECALFVLDYAMNRLDIHRIVAIIACDNLRSLQLAKRVGMHYERKLCHKNMDCFLYVIEKQEQNFSEHV